MEVVSDHDLSFNQMLIIQKYEKFLNYVYPIVMSISRGHLVLKNVIVETIHKIPSLVYQAIKSENVSKLYNIDSVLSEIRFYLRRMVFIKALTTKQLDHSLTLLSEVGKILGAWIKNKKNQPKNKKEFAS